MSNQGKIDAEDLRTKEEKRAAAALRKKKQAHLDAQKAKVAKAADVLTSGTKNITAHTARKRVAARQKKLDAAEKASGG